jgi:hypothetical protein
VWINDGRNEVVKEILQAGQKVILASGWYLDQQVPSLNGTTHYFWEDTFLDFYTNEIELGLEELPPAQLQQIMGGEVCLWQANEETMFSRMMPRSAAVAERLWSPKSKNMVNDRINAYQRIITGRCRFAQRGFHPAASRADFCQLPPSMCDDSDEY